MVESMMPYVFETNHYNPLYKRSRLNKKYLKNYLPIFNLFTFKLKLVARHIEDIVQWLVQ